jgi:hypothetical protein
LIGTPIAGLREAAAHWRGVSDVGRESQGGRGVAPMGWKAFPRERVAGLAVELEREGTIDGAQATVAGVVALADALRAQRLFATIVALADSTAWRNVTSARLDRILGQALIEEGRFDEARALLESIRDPVEALEARGLLGRIDKQLYVNEASAKGVGDPQRLRSAIDAYLTAYEADRSRPAWHGINAAALLCRAQRDGVAHARLGDATKLARAILRAVGGGYEPGRTSFWNLATAAEAELALGQIDRAELWLHRYAAADDTELFALASTVRQLQEVWGLRDDGEPGRRLLPPLKRALMRDGRQALIAPDDVGTATAATLEKVFGDTGFISPEKLKLGLQRCEAVGRVEELTGEGFGTGFAIPGAALRKSWGKAFVFVTNAHVLSASDPQASPPAKARVTFHALRDTKGKPFSTRFGEILASSPSDKLDFTIVALKAQPRGLAPIPVADDLPAPGSGQRLYAIGHPRGGSLMFSMQDNRLLDHGAPGDYRVHYRTPTEPGSSGSPVFDAGWDLVALHHAGSATMRRIHGEGTYEANEGIWIGKIRQALR